MPSRCYEFVDSRLRRSPPDRASAVPYGQAGENATRFPRLAHRSAAAHKLHSTPQQDGINLISGNHQTSSRLPPFSLFLPGSCPNNRDHRCEQVGQRGEPHLWVQFGLLRYLVELCFHHSSASVCADDVSRGQSSFAPPLPHVRGFPALGVLPASPTSLEASAFLRREPYRPAYSMHLLHQDFEGSLRFLDTSISERAVRLTPPQSPVPLP